RERDRVDGPARRLPLRSQPEPRGLGADHPGRSRGRRHRRPSTRGQPVLAGSLEAARSLGDRDRNRAADDASASRKPAGTGAIGAVHSSTHLAEPTSAALDFARHAAVAIENSRLVAETRGRIRTLEAVAAFTELDPTQPERARAEMGRLVERALAASHGALWLLEDGQLVRFSADGDEMPKVPVSDAAELLRLLVSPTGSRRMRALLDLLGSAPDAFAIPIQVEGRLAGLLVARMTASASETRRLAGVLAGQAAVLI